MMYAFLTLAGIATALLAWRMAHTWRGRVIAFCLYGFVFGGFILVINFAAAGAGRFMDFNYNAATRETIVNSVAFLWIFAILGVFWRIRKHDH